MLQTVQIVSGEAGTPWSRDQRQCVLEIRTEHKLNDPTSFSILVHDVPDRRGARHRPLEEGHQVAVLVRPRDRGAWHVLFQGKVDEVEENHTQGGVGSTVLFRGKDIRMKLAGYSHTGAWSGHVDAIMRSLIEEAGLRPEVTAPEGNFNEVDADENPLGQNSNNLDFLRTQAVAHGHNFWVSYARVPEATPGLGALNPLDDSAPSVTIEPSVNWAPSPFFSGASGNSGGGLAAAANAAAAVVGGGGEDSGPIAFKVHLNRNACPNVNTFEVVSEGTTVQTMPAEGGGAGAGAAAAAALADPTASAPGTDDPNVHFVPRVTNPGGEETPANEALERERGFTRKIKLSTTKAHINRICLPNDLATLEGVPDSVAGLLFRIRDVTHVIRIDGHWMDVAAESDGTSADAPAPGGLAEQLAGAL